MDRETIIRTIVAGLLVVGILFGWSYMRPIVDKWVSPAPAPQAPAKPGEKKPQAEKVAPPASAKASAGKAAPGKTAAEKPAPEKPSPETTAPPAITAAAVHAVGAEGAPPKPVLLGSAEYEGPYDLAAEITARGAAVERLTLARHRFFKTVEDAYKKPDERAAMDLVEPAAALPAFTISEMRVRLRGGEEWSTIDLSDVVWKAVAADGDAGQAVFAVDLADADGKRLLTVRKTFQIAPRPKPAPPGAEVQPQYQMQLKIEILAADDRVEKVSYALQGTPVLPTEAGRGIVPMAVAGAWQSGVIGVVQVTGPDIKGDAQPPTRSLAGTDVAWAGEMDKYFAVIMIPQKPSPEGTFAAGAEAFQYHVTEGDKQVPMPGVRLVSRELLIAPDKPIVDDCIVYAGPKDPDLLEKYYGHLGFQKLIIWAAPCCGAIEIPGVGFLSRLLAIVLDGFYALVHNYGVAIVLLVIVLRVAMHPITRWSTKSMLEMQKLAPRMQEIKAKYADDKERMQSEMAKIGGHKMLGGCLPMGLQMPIWLALYGALGAAIQLRHAAFIPAEWLPQGSMFLQDLSAPDALVHWHTPFLLPGHDIPLLGWLLSSIQGMMGGPLTSFNLLPILMGGAMYLQQLLMPTPTTAGPQAQQQKSMMVFMTIFMALVLYSAPAGLNLYIFTSSFFGYIEQWWIKKRLGLSPGSQPPPEAPPEDPKEAPAKAVRQQSLVVGREKSIAERIEAWMRRLTQQADEKPTWAKKGKGKRR